ncbi:hypothethical protein (plasmid) [Ralstonia solanacearum CMR15]|nr:hypothethical protein [Ralstonia solanacearum CMR15]
MDGRRQVGAGHCGHPSHLQEHGGFSREERRQEAAGGQQDRGGRACRHAGVSVLTCMARAMSCAAFLRLFCAGCAGAEIVFLQGYAIAAVVIFSKTRIHALRIIVGYKADKEDQYQPSMFCRRGE